MNDDERPAHRTPSQRRQDRAAAIQAQREIEETEAWIAENKLPGESRFDFTMRMQAKAELLYMIRQREFLESVFREPRPSDGPFIHIRRSK